MNLRYNAYKADKTLAGWINWYGSMDWLLHHVDDEGATMFKNGDTLRIQREPWGWFIRLNPRL